MIHTSFWFFIVGWSCQFIGETVSYSSCDEVHQPTIVNSFMTSDDDAYIEFIDINGELSNLIESPFGIEFLGNDFGFLEGPRWIEDSSYVDGGYLLFLEAWEGVIWKYYTNDTNNSVFECVSALYSETNDGPSGLGWNKNFPNEIFLTLFSGNFVSRFDLVNKVELNRWYYGSSDENEMNIIWSPDDIVIDSNGNGYFTNWPGFYDGNASIEYGVWKLTRHRSDDNNYMNDTFSVSLIEHLDYGTNGIAITLDECLVVASNSIDFAPGEYDAFDVNQVDYNNLYFRGYYLSQECALRHGGNTNEGNDDRNDRRRHGGHRRGNGHLRRRLLGRHNYNQQKSNYCASSESSESSEDNDDYYENLEGFMYFETIDYQEYFDASLILDSSEFDAFDNLWQGMITIPNGELPYAIIINPLKDENDPIIGKIYFGYENSSPYNFAYDNTNGYMYATIGNFATDYGQLVRIKINDGC